MEKPLLDLRVQGPQQQFRISGVCFSIAQVSFKVFANSFTIITAYCDFLCIIGGVLSSVQRKSLDDSTSASQQCTQLDYRSRLQNLAFIFSLPHLVMLSNLQKLIGIRTGKKPSIQVCWILYLGYHTFFIFSPLFGKLIESLPTVVLIFG